MSYLKKKNYIDVMLLTGNYVSNFKPNISVWKLIAHIVERKIREQTGKFKCWTSLQDAVIDHIECRNSTYKHK